jgi:flagellar biosynthesis/type III secretory pathway M-ring protein FliF/YscJ
MVKPTPTTIATAKPGKSGGVSTWTWSGIALVLLLAIAIMARIVIKKRRQKRHGGAE